ncbi:MAG: mRNA interferase RelE/StbE [Candidatus Omnitrophota bacterium]
MKWKLVITPRVQLALRTYSPQIKRYIRQALEYIHQNPEVGKPLKDDLAGFLSFKVRRFRIVYQIKRKVVTIYVIAIGHRQSIYDDLSDESSE